MKKFDFSIFHTARRAIDNLSFIEKGIFYTFAILLVVSTVAILGTLNNKILVTVPAHGGAVTEGILGTPRFGNPILALSDADRDLTKLVYAGLLKAKPDGGFVPELAEAMPTVSEDGLTYTFTIREDAQFHDGTLVSADDIVFTITRAQNPAVESPRRASWEGVTVEKIDERTVQFTLPQAYGLFLENTTLGILPAHLWEHVPPEQMVFSERNIEPIGAGPFRIKNTVRTDDGIVSGYTLSAFKRYVLGTPYLKEIRLVFYTNEEALFETFRDGNVDNVHGLSQNRLTELENGFVSHTYPLPRIFGVFFNQSRNDIFTNREVRVALNDAVDRHALVDTVLDGFGQPVASPLPPGLMTTQLDQIETVSNLENAVAILEENGWGKNDAGIYENEDGQELSFTLTTANVPELAKTAEMLKEMWENLGVRVTVALYDVGQLTSDVIRPREYDALLFGQIVGRDRDLFPFWHSSQRNDPGLNVALYANITTDAILENIRTSQSEAERTDFFEELESEIASDVPATFLFAPHFTYLTRENLEGVNLGVVVTPADRFLNVHEWYVDTNRVWEAFAPAHQTR